MNRHENSVPGAAPRSAGRRRAAAFAATLAFAVLLVLVGIDHEEVGEVMFNACMLCLSCIGIG